MISRRDFLVRSGGIAAASAMADATYARPAIGRVLARGKGEQPLDTFDLEITITGLCFFWSAKSPPPGPRHAQHVLMVSPVLNGAQCKLSDQERASVPQHYPRLFYDAAYDTQVPLGMYRRVVALEGAALDLSQYKGSETNIPAIPDLLDIGPFAPHQLPDPALANAPNLACRVTLPPGLAASETSDGWSLEPPWNAPAQSPRKAAWLVTWTVHAIPAAQLDWKLDSLTHGAKSVFVPNLPPLKPVEGKIALTISNVVLGESRPDPKTANPSPPECDTEAMDFRAFLDLYGGGSGPWPKLVYRGTGTCGAGGTPYTCLPSGGK